MRRETASEILMFIGVGGGIAFILINLYAPPAAVVTFGGLLLYLSIVAILSGLISYLLARAHRT